NKIVPLRVDSHFAVSPRDPDPRGMPVFGADGRVAGVVSDLWVDRAEACIRYLEVKLETEGGSTRLLPMTDLRIVRHAVQVDSILAEQFGSVPTIKTPDEITMLEEERIMAFYAGGRLYATPMRAESWL